MRYSASSNAFYPESIDYPNLPKDVITVSDEEATLAQNAPQGSIITIKEGRLIIAPPNK